MQLSIGRSESLCNAVEHHREQYHGNAADHCKPGLEVINPLTHRLSEAARTDD